jgi:uncharacterized protein (DUF488 family)
MLRTVGHGTLSEAELAELLRAADVRHLVDIRIAPGSRRNPHLARSQLEVWLPEAGIDYRWERRLGGFRKPPPDSPDQGLRNTSFRGYAAHMRSADFCAAIDDLLAGDVSATAVMCSESVWWRCHRRLVADHVTLVREVPVAHVLPGGRLEPHRPTDTAALVDGVLFYPPGPDQPPLL